MRYNQSDRQAEPQKQRRRLKTKPLLMLIAVLFIGNIIWFTAFIAKGKPKETNEAVASVAGEAITREEWMEAMEQKAGRDVLLELVNSKVMETAAKKYGISVSDEEIDLELSLISSVDGSSHSGMDTGETRQQIRSSLILDKVLTNDILIKEEAVRRFYDDNESLYHIVTAYRTSAIFVPTKEEAETVMDELSKGSDFTIVAKERSTDSASANLGGDLGFINEKTETADPAILSAAAELKEGRVSKPVALADGTFAVIRVNEKIEGRSFTFEEVKEHIRRELALEQLPQSVNPEAFWKEFKTEWFYGK